MKGFIDLPRYLYRPGLQSTWTSIMCGSILCSGLLCSGEECNDSVFHGLSDGLVGVGTILCPVPGLRVPGTESTAVDLAALLHADKPPRRNGDRGASWFCRIRERASVSGPHGSHMDGNILQSHDCLQSGRHGGMSISRLPRCGGGVPFPGRNETPPFVPRRFHRRRVLSSGERIISPRYEREGLFTLSK